MVAHHDERRWDVLEQAAAEVAHRQAPHYLKWRDTVQDWFAAETTRLTATPVYPPEAAWSKR